MVQIPDRENLESMSRTDIQKLCKDNNIKANMRTDEMIKALCDLMNGKDVPRPTRIISERTASHPPNSRLLSVQGPVRSTSSKLDDTVVTKKVALQPSESSNTDVESVASTPASLISVPTTRRKAKDIQTRLGKGRPVAAGGSGARKITKAFSKGTGRKPKSTMVLQAPTIPEEAEDPVQKITPPVTEEIEVTDIEPAVRLPSPSSPHPRFDPPQDTDNDVPVGLPTPAPSHPSYSLPQASALETRVTELEGSDIANRLSTVESSLASIQSPLIEVPALKNLFEKLDTANKNVEAQVAELTKMHTELKARTNSLEDQVKSLLSENVSLKQKVSELQIATQSAEDVQMRTVMLPQKDVEKKGESDSNGPTLVLNPPLIGPADLSPSEPTLGKRIRSDTDTPDTSGTESGQRAVDPEMSAIHRVKRPQKKPRLDPDEDTIPFPFADRLTGPPTSTPRLPSISRQKPSTSPPSFFTASCAAPTPMQRKKDDLEFYLLFDEDNGQVPNNQEDNKSPVRPKSAILRTPSPKTIKLPSASGLLNPIHDPNFFAGTHSIFQGHLQPGELPFPLIPTTPPNPSDPLNQSAQYATPRLGDPWRPQTGTSDTQASAIRGTSGFDITDGSGVPKSPPSPDSHSVRPGNSRREQRTDKYNPYFTPQRGSSGSRQRTGLTPIHGFSLGLKSPALLSTVAEDERGENADEDSSERSPPQFRTLYGTELDGDTRFGDFGRDLAKSEWGRFHPPR